MELNENILATFCDSFDDYLISNNLTMKRTDTVAYRWLSITSNELLTNISIFKRFALNKLLKRDGHIKMLDTNQALILRISENSDDISYIAPLSPINIAETFSNKDEYNKVVVELTDLFSQWVKKDQYDNIRSVIADYWEKHFGITDFELKVTYTAKRNLLGFSVKTNLRNKKNIKKYYRYAKALFPRSTYNLNIDKSKQILNFEISTYEESDIY